jgi:hypothetical protein
LLQNGKPVDHRGDVDYTYSLYYPQIAPCLLGCFCSSMIDTIDSLQNAKYTLQRYTLGKLCRYKPEMRVQVYQEQRNRKQQNNAMQQHTNPS